MSDAFADVYASMDLRALAAAACAERDSLKAELAAYRSVVVPRADYDRAISRAEAAEQKLDQLASQLLAHETHATSAQAARGDESVQARLSVATRSLKALVAQLERIGGHSWPEEQAALRVARAVIAEEEGR